jgi:anti-sigma factor RsiW
MSRHSDDRLVAYLDGEIEAADQREIKAWLESDPAACDKLAALAGSAELLRQAYDEILREPVPDRLIAAARGEIAPQSAPRVLPFKPRRVAPPAGPRTRWRIALPIAASLLGFLAGGGAAYYGFDKVLPIGVAGTSSAPAVEAAAANNLWLDNAAGDYKLFVSTGDKALIDVPATGDSREALQKISQSLTQQVRLPDLKPWGLNFQGARLVVADGRPAAQLVYTTDNKAIGSLALIIGSSKQSDIAPTFDRRQDVNMLYWRHQGHAYVLIGQANAGYLWGIGNDVAWQLDAI